MVKGPDFKSMDDISLLHYVEYAFQRSFEEWKAGNILRDSNLYSGAISRYYYAVFHAVRSLLILKKIAVSSHRAIIDQIALQFVREGKLPRDFCKRIRRLFDERMASDYDPIEIFTKEDAFNASNNANQILRECIKLYKTMVSSEYHSKKILDFENSIS